MDKNIVFASLALEMGLLSETQVKESLSLLQKTPNTSLSQICMSQGWLTPQNIVTVENKVTRSIQQQTKAQKDEHEEFIATLKEVEKVQHKMTQKISSDVFTSVNFEDACGEESIHEVLDPGSLAKVQSLHRQITQSMKIIEFVTEESSVQEDSDCGETKMLETSGDLPKQDSVDTEEILDKVKKVQDCTTKIIGASTFESAKIDLNTAKDIDISSLDPVSESIFIADNVDTPEKVEETATWHMKVPEKESVIKKKDDKTVTWSGSENDTDTWLNSPEYGGADIYCDSATELPPMPEDVMKVETFRDKKFQMSIFGVGDSFGDYCLLEEVAKGGMGTVYKARDNRNHRIVAIKIMHYMDLKNEKQVARFHREIESVGRLEHPNIVSIYDSGSIEKTHYYTMEFIEGECLSEYYKKRKIGPINVARMMQTIISAVHHAHTNHIIHRDIKPANIIIDNEDNPHITDFGLAKDLTKHSDLTQSGTTIGTPYYMAPEQTTGEHEKIGAHTDVYALGVILYELLTEKLPFTASRLEDLYDKIVRTEPEPPHKINPSIPRNLELITLKAMAKSPQWRYSSAEEMACDLERFLSGKSITARPTTPIVKAARLIWPYRFYAVMVTLILSCIVFALLIVISKNDSPSLLEIQDKILDTQLKTLDNLLVSGQYEQLQQQAQQCIESYPNVAKSNSAYYYLGKGLQEQQQYEKALQAYIKYYWFIQESEKTAEALMAMAECSLHLKKEEQAWSIMKSLEKYQLNTAEYFFLYGKIAFYTGQFDIANSYFEKIAPASLDRQKKSDFQNYKTWLKPLNPVVYIPFIAEKIALVDLENDKQLEIVAWTKQECRIYRLVRGEYQLASSLVKPAIDMQFTGPVIAADIYGNGDKKIIMAAKTQENGNIIVYHKSGEAFIPSSQSYVFEDANIQILLAKNLRSDQKDDILLMEGFPNRKSWLIHFNKKPNGEEGIVKQPIFKEFQTGKDNNDILSAFVCDIDRDRSPDLVMGTGNWNYYDVRLYNFDKNKQTFIPKATQKLGKVSGCSAIDLDNTPESLEIIACKTHTYNSEVFGTTPNGKPDGVYVMKYNKAGTFKNIWESTVPFEKKQKNFFYNLHSGLLGNIPAITCIHSQSKEDQQKTWVWLIRYYKGNFEKIAFTMPEAETVSCLLGDVDGDKEGELVLCGPDGISVYGVEAP